MPEVFAGAEIPSAARDLHKLLECLARRKRLDVRFYLNQKKIDGSKLLTNRVYLKK